MEFSGSDRFFAEINESSRLIKNLLYPLEALTPRERTIFTEYHYWKTGMREIAANHNISIGRAYELLNRAEERLTQDRTQEKDKNRS